MKISVYFQTWSSVLPWTTNPLLTELAGISYPISNVNLAFAQPGSTYLKGQETFSGTGLDFSLDFQTVKAAIQILHEKNITVMLSVGGSTFSWDDPNYLSLGYLVQDLGLDGIDLDWEPVNGIADSKKLGEIISRTYTMFQGQLMDKKLSLTGWSTGAYNPLEGNLYQGMDQEGLVGAGTDLDWINIMTYDAGPTFDPQAALLAYRKFYQGPINLGFEVGPQSWGGAVLSLDDAIQWSQFALNENPANGIFIWSLEKPAEIDAQDVIQAIQNIPSVESTHMHSPAYSYPTMALPTLTLASNPQQTLGSDPILVPSGAVGQSALTLFIIILICMC